MIALIAVIFVYPVSAQQNTGQSTTLLSSYYSIKDALVADNANLAASKAAEFVKILNKEEVKTIDAPQLRDLAATAGKIAASNALNSQRDYFAVLSAHLISIAKTSKLSAEPIYELYCPMKKSSWLSSKQAIQNPYYGSTMLTCGKVTKTIK